VYYVTGSGWGSSRADLGAVKIPIIYWPISVTELRNNTGGTITTGGAYTYMSMGWGPMQTFYLPMKQLLTDGVETVDTNAYGRIDLKTTSGSGASTSAIGTIVAEYDKPNTSE